MFARWDNTNSGSKKQITILPLDCLLTLTLAGGCIKLPGLADPDPALCDSARIKAGAYAFMKARFAEDHLAARKPSPAKSRANRDKCFEGKICGIWHIGQGKQRLPR